MALIITVIVLLILAMVSISLIINSGIITKSKTAVDKYSDEQISEQIGLAIQEYKMQQFVGTDKTELEYMEESLGDILGGNLSITKSGKIYKIESGNTVYRFREDGLFNKYEKMSSKDVYGRIEGNTLKLRSTNLGDKYYLFSNSESIQSNWNKEGNATKELVKYIEIEEPIAPSGGYEKFKNLTNLEEIINIKNLHTENISNMSCMFQNCGSLKRIDLSGFDTCKASNLYGLFIGCSSLESIDIRMFDTSQTTGISNMFSGCTNLKEINLDGIDTSNFTALFGIFYDCSSLKQIDLSSLDTKNVTDVRSLFWKCTSLEFIDLGGLFSMDSVTKTDNMLNNVPKTVKIKANEGTIYKIKQLRTDFDEDNFV